MNYCLVFFFLFLFTKSQITRKNVDRRKHRKLKDKLFFSPFLGFGIRLFIPMTISSFLTIEFQLHNEKV